MASRGSLSLQEYYAKPAVRTRVHEYCGGTDQHNPSAIYVIGTRASDCLTETWTPARRQPAATLDQLMAEGADLARSVWDAESLLICLDIDYLNIDFRGEAFYHPADVFFKLEPTFRAARQVFDRFGLPLVSIVTGQGYHFTGRVPLDSAVVTRLAESSPAPPWWSGVRARSAWASAALTERTARAWSGLGRIMEYLAHQIIRKATRRSPIPITLNGTSVGSGLVGRECVSIDLSAFGDPMDVRHIRVAFSGYQQHRFRPDVVGNPAAARPPLVAIPRGRRPLARVLCERDPRHAARLARSSSTALPVVTAGLERIIGAYERSSLAAFHRRFYAAPHRSATECDALVGALAMRSVPNCVARPLTEPNDLLLRPVFVQHVTRWLLAEGMKPRDIAAIIRARYAADYGWGERWTWLDPETRAEFDVRVFAGLLSTGLDRGVDFNCRSAQEKGLCPLDRCERDLRAGRDRLLDRVAI